MDSHRRERRQRWFDVRHRCDATPWGSASAMTGKRRGRSHRRICSARRIAAAVATFVIAMAGCLILVAGIAAIPDPASKTASLPNSATDPIGKAKPLHRSAPIRVDIEAIDVHAPVVPTGVDENGDVAVPPLSHAYLTNWYKDSPTPGQDGNAVILGHVDSPQAATAVFRHLGRLKKGSRISVTRKDNTVVVFAVTSIALYPKSTFPTSLVYGPSQTPGLRLITCGGTVDAHANPRHANIIVTAEMISSHQATADERRARLGT